MEKYSDTINNIGENIGNAASNTVNTVKDSLNSFSSTNYINAGREFLESNSMIAKFVFIIFIVIVFVILFNLGIYLITWFSQSSLSPYLIKGLINGNQFKHISQDPKKVDSITLYRSNNQPTGIEFSWSVWLNINDPGTTKYSHIFNMGNGDFGSDGIATVNNGPGLYLKNDKNMGTLHVVMDTLKNDGQSDTQSVDIGVIPLGKWFHVLIRMENNVLDVYINGVITTRMNLLNVPRLNYNDIYICANSGFNGNLSNLRYFDYALNVFEINRIVSTGPNMKMLSSNQNNQYYYLSSSWYDSKINLL
jgi:hypothetical protein